MIHAVIDTNVLVSAMISSAGNEALFGRSLSAKIWVPGVAGISPDPGDDKFIACALAGKVDFLVTENKRHFPQSLQSGVKVLNAAE